MRLRFVRGYPVTGVNKVSGVAQSFRNGGQGDACLGSFTIRRHGLCRPSPQNLYC